MLVYLWTFCPVLLIHISGFVSVPYCFDYCCFVVFSEVSSLFTPCTFFFLKIALALQFLISIVGVQSLIHV